MNDSTPSVPAAALAACAAGLSVLPPREDGTKAPIAEEHDGQFTWRHRQRTRATEGEVRRWYAHGRHGLGIVCGSVSGGAEGRSLVALDFDDPSAWRSFLGLAEAAGLGELLGRVEGGYCEATPKGGRHLLATCPGEWPTQKLAERPDPAGGPGRSTLVETKCEGGFLVIAPSHGPVHPSGRPYRLLSGGLDQIEEVTPEEWRSLCDLASCLDETPQSEMTGANFEVLEISETCSREREREREGEPPGSAFAAQATWADLLTAHGWTPVYRRGETEYWRRPGKAEGISATTNVGGSGFFYCFSTSTPFQARRSYTKFGAYALLECGGDHSAAAKQLASRGFGSPSFPTTRNTSLKPLKAQNSGGNPETGQGGNPAEAASPEPWGDPVLDTVLPPDPFPLDVLPPPLAEFARVAAEGFGCPVDFPALASLGVAAGAIGRSAAIRIKEGWIEGSALYLGLVGEPGMTKSPAVALLARPLWAISGELVEMHRRDKDLAEEQEDAPRPVLRRVVVDDATVESLAPILQDNPRGLVMVRDELTALFAGHNQYKAGGKGADRQFYLSAWSGASVAVDRKSNPDRVPILIRHPHLSIVGGMTPGMLSEMAEAKGRDDGFLDRMLFGFPEPVPVRWHGVGLPRPMGEAWEQAVRAMWLPGLVRAEDGVERPFVAAFGAAALDRYAAWFDDHCREAEGDDFPPHLRGPWAKFRAYCARLALVLDRLGAAYDPTDPAPAAELGLASVEAAIRLVGYFKAHTRRVRALMRGATRENPDARATLRWLRKGERTRFTERDAQQNFRRRFPADGPELGDALRWLEARHCIRPVPAPDRKGPGRTPSPVYEVNPALLARA